MSGEMPPATQEQAGIAPEILEKMSRYGGEEYFQERFGMGVEELSAEVEFGPYKGPMLDALVPDDPLVLQDIQAASKVCPMGQKVETAHQTGGLSAVEELLSGVSAFAPEFRLKISPKTRAYEMRREVPQKKN